MKRDAQGFSLIELAVAMAIMGILLALALPAFTNYIRDVRVRGAAESFLSGVQLARTEAVRRNVQVEFLLTASDPVAGNVGSATASVAGENWMVRTADLAVFIEGKLGADGRGAGPAININDTTAPASNDPDAPPGAPVASILFNPLGRTTLATDAVFKFTSPQGVCKTAGGPVRCLKVAVSVFGQARLCDPKVAAVDTRSC